MSNLVDPVIPFQIQLALLPKGVTRDKQNNVFCQFSLMISFFVPTPNPPPPTPTPPPIIDHPFDVVRAAFAQVKTTLPTLLWAWGPKRSQLPLVTKLFPD